MLKYDVLNGKPNYQQSSSNLFDNSSLIKVTTSIKDCASTRNHQQSSQAILQEHVYILRYHLKQQQIIKNK